MKRFGLGTALFVLLAGLVGCDGLKGHLTVNSQLTLKDKKGKEVILAKRGTRNAEVKITGEPGRNQELEIKTKNDQGKKITVKIAAPAGVILPTSNGEFTLVGNQIGQTVDVKGTLTSGHHDSESVSSIEACTHVYRRQVCQQQPRRDRNGAIVLDRNGRPMMDNVCRTEDINLQGRREIVSHTSTDSLAGNLTLLEMGTSNVLAAFSGGKSNSYQVVEAKGPCIIR